jgi:hypothetical protein
VNIVSPYPTWYFIFCILLGALLAFLLYRNDKKLIEFSKLTKGILFSLRFLCISVLAAMLLSPLLKYFNKTVEKPIIIIAQDNSASMNMAADSAFVKTALQQQLADVKSKLEENYRVESYLFDEKISGENELPNFQGKITDFDVLFESIEQRFVNRNVGGLLVISDGIYNQGNSPVYSTQSLEFPIFTLGVGDTNKYVDVQLRNLRNNKLAFLGNEFPVQIDVKTQKLQPTALTLKVFRGEKLIKSQQITSLKTNGLTTQRLALKADVVGKQQYTIVVESVDGERNTLNNRINFYIDVLDGRQKVLLLGMAPHPDLGALKAAIISNENYELTSTIYSEFTGAFDAFDLVILHQSVNGKLVPIDQKMKDLLAESKPILLVGGGWKNVELLKDISGKSSNRNTVNDAQAQVNESFSLFTVDEDIRKVSNFPPLATEANQVVKSNGNQTLLTQKIGSVVTSYPLLSFYEMQDVKLGRFSGEGIWKWRMASFQEFGNHDVFNRFVGKVVQYMAIKSDRSFFRVSTINELYENEAINFSAQLFNPSYELINDPDVNLELTNQEGKSFTYSMNRSGETYQLNIPSLAPATYNYAATTTFQGKRYSEMGVFTVKELRLEALNTEANHQLLFQLAKRTNGEMLTADDLAKFPETIASREDVTSVSYVNEEVQDIINLKWIFFLLLALLSVEWFIRKRGGAY